MSWLGLLVRNLLLRRGRSTFTLLGVALAVGGGGEGGVATVCPAVRSDAGVK